MIDFSGQKITIVGAGVSGQAAASLVVRGNGTAKISESAPLDAVARLCDGWQIKDAVVIESGGHTQAFIEDSDLVVISPGVRIDALPVQWARKKNIAVIGEIEFAWRFCIKPVIAVTGSNGKTTVTTLIGESLKKAGKRVCVCGNIGSPFSGYAADLDNIDFVVLEVSSFQLESIVHFRPFIAVVLNLSQNHLDRHKDFAEYRAAKKRIFMNQTATDYAVLNDTLRQGDFTAGIKSQISYFNDSRKTGAPELNNPNYLAVQEVCRIVGVDQSACRDVFDGFKGVEHRLEWVRDINGVAFINDSKSTTAEAGRWALEQIEKPIIMICGGRDKNIDFSGLADAVGRKVKHMFLIGEAREKLRRSFQDVVAISECNDLKDAVTAAQRTAQPGECVLLSPMCASFDMFSNFEERGRVFKEIVNGL